ncbi:outer membrane beta-barrel protein [Rugamonas sp. CCM 8940]|uniref:outer membrane beta-barrel protein n=1 Tax=Rugamonas sp. CCM 8940 TaxID=2765359 RepID=UPI0018F3D30B|nr:outer membrane beta-barrel protein [Rugamonas sp. CCM 8940]MBJ7311725.1 outer membrane beta-barrel protein [Rugamonas sp. CCM 8940]
MKPILTTLLFAAATGYSSLALADDFYVGANLASKSEGHINQTGRDGKTTRADSKNGGIPVKVYGGYNISPLLALEGGYQRYGTNHFDLPLGGQLGAEAHAFYAAAKGTLALNEQWSLFGKLGVARTSSKITVSGLGAASDSRSANRNSLYASVGGAYAISQQLSVQLEWDRFGKVNNEGFVSNLNNLSLGLRYSF